MWYDAVIVAEKPGVARAFAAYLSSGRRRIVEVVGVPVHVFKHGGGWWAAVGVRGHLMDFDFPREYGNWRKVDPSQLFYVRPVRVLRRGMLRYVKALRQLARSTSRVILALDADVEGEAIAFEVIDVMRRANPHLKFERVWFSAVTRRDLVEALSRPRDPDPRMASKAFARMVLDLTIGAAFTRTLTLMVEGRDGRLPKGRFLSYGPCQTPVLYLVVKRAIERESFKGEKFYEVVAELEAGDLRFRAKLDKRFDGRDEAARAADALMRARAARIVRADYLERSVEPPEPLATVELERRASRFLDIRPKEAMDVAEDLYQEGLISYPRTDTTRYPPTINLRAIAAMFARHEEVGEYVKRVILSQRRLRVRQGREDDRAHPPIYPLKYAPRNYVVGRFGVGGFKLYDLVVRHFLATLSPPMRVESQKVEAEAAGMRLTATGLKVLDPGYTLVYHYERPRESPLPRLARGQEAGIVSVKVVEGETRPPPYLSEAELLKLMKRYGIGTDATMQDHIHTNVERRYFRVVRRRCIPTPLGRTLIAALSEVVPEAVLPEVRGRMEAELRAIVEGLKEADEVIREVKERFYEYLQRLRSAEERVAEELARAVSEVFDVGGGGTARSKRRAAR